MASMFEAGEQISFMVGESHKISRYLDFRSMSYTLPSHSISIKYSSWKYGVV